VRKADNLPPSCADVMKSGGLNLLEPCGPVQACNGTALPLSLPLPNTLIVLKQAVMIGMDIFVKIEENPAEHRLSGRGQTGCLPGTSVVPEHGTCRPQRALSLLPA
jgi:hypothetical protein